MSDAASPRILGIDPGSTRTGFGIITGGNGTLALIAAGALGPPASASLPEKLLYLFAGLERIIAEHAPQEVAIEGLFHARNSHSTLVLGHARGVAVLAAARAGLPVYEYAPREIKKALVGTGTAEKEQVRNMVRLLLKLSRDITPLDASDGVAIAICHAHSRRLRTLAVAPAPRR